MISDLKFGVTNIIFTNEEGITLQRHAQTTLGA